MKQTNELIITIKKKDVRRSLNSCQNEHGQILCAFDSRQQPTSVLAYWSNHLSGTKINNFDELQKKINEKITKWKKTKHLNVKDFMLFVAWELQLRASKKNNKYFSYYLDLYENKETIVLRISDHHFDAETEKNHPAKYTTSVTFSNEKPEDWDYFKADPNVNAVEYVYYEDKVTKDDLISIAKDIIEFVETGKFTPSVKPNEINESPKPTANNLSGGLHTDLPKAISDIVNDTTIKCMLDIYPSKRGSKIVKKHSLEYKDKDGFRRGWEISEKIFRCLLNQYHLICNPASVALFDYKANNYDALIDQKRYNLQFDLINEYFMYVDDYWLSTYLHYEDEDCRKHLLRQYAYETTAEEYINDAYKYALMKKCKLHKDENGLLQELELQLLDEESPVKITIKTFENIVKQYNSLKQNPKYKDVILIFTDSKIEIRTALCYICEKDAEIAGKILKVKPTKLGLIFHRNYLEKYLSKLTHAGYCVGIVEEKKGLKGVDNWNITELDGINFDNNFYINQTINNLGSIVSEPTKNINDVLSELGLGKIVYHNSPFLLKKADGSFIDPITKEKLGFDNRFMGKGEGSQVHGWGSYFSVNDLRKYGEPKSIYYYDGELLQNIISKAAYNILLLNNFELDSAIGEVMYHIERLKPLASRYDKILSELKSLKQSKIIEKRESHHYVIEIPDNDGTNYIEEGEPLTDKQLDMVLTAFDMEVHDVTSLKNFIKSKNGRKVYDYLSRDYGMSPEKTSKALKKAGFVGIHYFGNQDGECYVIFDENDAKIVKHELFGLGSIVSEPTKQTFYENLYKQLESIVKNDSFEKNGIRNFILSHIPEDYKNDDIEGIVEVFYQRLRALKCGTKGLGAIHKFNIGDTIKMTSGVTAKIIDFIDGDKYKIEFDDTVAGRKKIAIYFWKLEEKAVLSDDYNVGDLVSYKGFEETVFQIVGFKGNNYVVIELGDRTRTKNEIPFADKDKLQRAVSPLLEKEMELEKNNLGNIVEELQPSGLSGFEAITKYIESTMQNGGTTDNRQIRTVCEQNGINLDEHITKVKEAVEIGLMHVARNIAQSDKPLRQKYDELIDLYNRQPYVGTKKTLKQMVLQQYSTPLPIAFLMSEFVKNKSNSSLYFEPSAGNGFLTISLPQENTICNEIDRYRLENLKNEHYRKVSEQDARQPFEYSRIFDGVVTNPPFLKGQETNAMIFNALETMKDSGRCAILRDGNAQFTEYAGTKLRSSFTGFYDKLFQEYNVVKIININAKKIYAKQGTSFFMHIILINGRRANKLSDDDSMHRVYNPEIDKIELAGFEELWEYFLPYFIDETTYYYYSLANKSKLLFKELELTIEVGDEFVKEKQLSWKQKSKIDYWLRTNKVKDKEIFDFYYVSNINKNGDIYLFNEQNDITQIYTRKEFYELGLQFYKHYKPKGLGNLEPDFVKYQNFIKKSLENKHYKDELDCTELVSEYNRNKASNMLNKEITKFYLISDDIRHLQKHSKDNEYKKGQIPLTMSDFLRIPEILSNPDELLLPQSNPKNGQGIAFIKTFADGKQYCILIDKYEDGELSPKTGYKKPLRGLNGFYSVHDRCPAKQSPNLTSVTPKVPRRFVAKITNFFVITK